MMLRLLLLITLLALAACDSAPEVLPTSVADVEPEIQTEATPPPPPAQPTVESVPPPGVTPETDEEGFIQDPLAAAGVQLPLPGTIQAPATADPNPDMMFDSILFYQTGGAANIELVIEVFSDGRVVRNGQTSAISEAQVIELDNAIKAMNFFGIQGQFSVPGASEEVYIYRITVERDGASRMITAQDGYVPQPMLELFGMITALGT